jgi:hypothetical protein
MDDEECFNVESSAATAELEALVRDEAIGSTLYDKKWVIRTVLALGRKEEEDTKDESECASRPSSDLASLVEMTIENDVCEYIVESGCLDVILNCIVGTGDDVVVRQCLVILANVEAKTGAVGEALPNSISVLFNSSDALTLASAFLYLKSFCEAEKEAALIRALNTCFLDKGFVRRTAFLLASSSNNELLDAVSKFLLSLFDAGFERLEDEFSDSDYSGSEFVQACSEALKEADGGSSFRLMEIVGMVCNEDNVVGCAQDLCAFATRRLCDSGDDLTSEVLSLSGKILWHCWRLVRHDESWTALKGALEAAAANSEADDERFQAAKINVERCLEQYRQWYNMGGMKI